MPDWRSVDLKKVPLSDISHPAFFTSYLNIPAVDVIQTGIGLMYGQYNCLSHDSFEYQAKRQTNGQPTSRFNFTQQFSYNVRSQNIISDIRRSLTYLTGNKNRTKIFKIFPFINNRFTQNGQYTDSLNKFQISQAFEIKGEFLNIYTINYTENKNQTLYNLSTLERSMSTPFLVFVSNIKS